MSGVAPPCLLPLRFCPRRPVIFPSISLGSNRSVVSNASIWDTLRLVPKGALPEEFVKEREATPQCKSFMHVSEPGHKTIKIVSIH